MAKITAMFWDVGGVLLTNGWDRPARRRAVENFKLDWDDFEDRHELMATRFETGRSTLDRYLDRTIFYRSRDFSKDKFREFMFAQSQPIEATLNLAGRLAHTGEYLLATLNNESRELNLYRIEHFGLRKYFSFFISSCFVGVKKPDDEMFRLALDLSQRSPEECVFIDDRELNLECAGRYGLRTLRFRSATELESELRGAGVEF
jgi:putative hydrolase of the HAD superfamily